MNRTEFVVATAIVLFLAFLLGWFMSWLIHRLTGANRADISELDRMAQSLHEAEELRDQAIAYLEVRESEMTSDLQQCQAELSAAMEGLRASRHEAADLRAYIERVNLGG